MKPKRLHTDRRLYLLALLALLLFQRCSVNKQMAKGINSVFKDSPMLNDHAVGFALSDLDKGKLIYEKDADKYFIPASNTKLFTFYAGLKMIPDSVPSLRYIEKGDSLIFWGTGDPSFLQRELKGIKVLEFLRSSDKQLFFSPGRYTGKIYGQGWAWDDYNDYYQAEITELPLQDNLIEIKKSDGKLSVLPALFNDCLLKDSLGSGLKPGQTFQITRTIDQNEFNYPEMVIPAGFSQLVPYKTSTLITLNLLSDTLKRLVQLIRMKMPATAKTVYSMKSDDVLSGMLLPSDNFIAEQLLLVYSNQFQPELNGTDAIHYILEKYLSFLPDKPRWVDGSGLSRMNLFSPRDITTLLQLIDKEINNREKLFSMLPAGGKTGTLKNAYPATSQPFVFGKTGSFSNNYNQSGYVLTKKGRTLVFSFMNNNFVNQDAEIRKEVAKMITYIHNKF